MTRRLTFGWITVLSVIVLAALIAPESRSAYCADKVSFAIVFPGGPDAKAEGKKFVDQFMQTIAGQTRLKADAMQGEYFNDAAQSLAYLKANSNAFIMGSLGFFLSNRKSLKLQPLATVTFDGSDREVYYLLVKKGKHRSINDLKGKTVSGSVLYEDARFLNAVIFNGKIDVKSHFKLKPSQRPLSEVRRVTTDAMDAVMLNQMQFQSLKQLPQVFSKLEVIYKSQPLPALGLMMVETKKTLSARDDIMKAVSRMCGLEDGKTVCKNFGIGGFVSVKNGEFDEIIKNFDSAR